jgi:hypothetical protein
MKHRQPGILGNVVHQLPTHDGGKGTEVSELLLQANWEQTHIYFVVFRYHLTPSFRKARNSCAEFFHPVNIVF